MKHKLLCCTAFMCGIFTFRSRLPLSITTPQTCTRTISTHPHRPIVRWILTARTTPAGGVFVVPSPGRGRTRTAQRPAKAHLLFRSVRMLIRGVTPWNSRSTQTKS